MKQQRIFLLSVISIVIMVILPVSNGESSKMEYIYPRPESDQDTRSNYYWEVLQAALEITTPTYGEYELRPSEDVMSTERKRIAIEKGYLTVKLGNAVQENDARFTCVGIPLDKGILGHRVLLIRKEDQPKFDVVNTLEDLRKYKVGQGAQWGDVKVYEHNGIPVEKGSNYEGLFKMLDRGRFDFFSRGINEIIQEYEERKTELPDLAIEQSILLVYPWTMVFSFAKTEQGEMLAKRVAEGIMAIIANGTLDKIFNTYYGKIIKELHLKDRKIIRLENPYLSPELPLEDKRLWYDPKNG